MGSYTSPLEIYIQAQKDRQDADSKAVALGQAQSDAAIRLAEAKNVGQRLEDEHKAKMAELDSHQAQIESARAQLAHAHLQSRMAIQKGISEGSIPIPQPNFTPNVQQNAPTQLQGTQIQIPALPQGNLQNAPLTFDGQTIPGNEYNTPSQQVTQTAPLNTDAVTQQKALTTAKEEALQPARDQQVLLDQNKTDRANAIEQLKIESAQKVADTRELGENRRATLSANSRIAAAQINASAKDKSQEIDPGQIEDRASQLKYGEGPTMGHSKLDIAAASVLQKQGARIVNPKTVDNIKSLKPLENFTSDMTDFANKYLGDSIISRAANKASLSDFNPVTTDERNDFNQLLLQATNVAKSVEGATGRILQSQIQTAKDFIANKNVTKSQLIGNAKKLNDLTVQAAEGQLGNLSPDQRVDFLEHHGLNTLAANAAAKYKLATPKKAGRGLLDDPRFEVVK